MLCYLLFIDLLVASSPREPGLGSTLKCDALSGVGLGWVGLGTACVLQKNGTPVAAARVGSQYPNVPRIIYYFETKQLLEGVGYAVSGHVLRIIPNLSFFLRTVRSSNLTCVLYCTVLYR